MSRKFYFGDIFKDGRYKPLHKDLFVSEGEADVAWATKWLAPTFDSAKAAAVGGAASNNALREESPGVYSFDLFTPEFCDLLLQEVEHAQQTNREELDRPNGMNRYGIVLNQLGLEPLITALQQKHLQPLQGALFPEEGGTSDDHHCFIVRYKAGEDVGLDMHEDDSDVTLNVCLGKEFRAATLSFCGRAADEDHRKLRYTYSHQKGRAVLHLGRHRHGADNIESGERVNFILWSTSSRYRASESYQRHRMRSTTALDPDPVCLSYTHDKDYTAYLRAPTNAEAVARGVMLDVVERRLDKYRRPVHDLAKPLDEINEVPSVCLFLENLSPQQQHGLFRSLMELATDVRLRRRAAVGGGEAEAAETTMGVGGGSASAKERAVVSPQILFFVAVQAQGAVPQVRGLCGVSGSPALAILDVDKEQVHVLDKAEGIDATSMRAFVEAYLAGELAGRARPLGGGGGGGSAADAAA